MYSYRATQLILDDNKVNVSEYNDKSVNQLCGLIDLLIDENPAISFEAELTNQNLELKVLVPIE